MTDPREDGEDLFKAKPDLILLEVAQIAHRSTSTRENYEYFIAAYVNARKRRSELAEEGRS
jgi:hypothetical protein